MYWLSFNYNFMMLAGDLRNGSTFYYNNEPYVVIGYTHRKLGQGGGARVILKIRNLKNKKVTDLTLNSIDKIESLETETRTMQYLYEDGDAVYLMDPDTFEQEELPMEMCKDQLKFMKPECKVAVLKLDGETVSLVLPNKVALRISETMDVDKGNTASGTILKEATLETGAVVKVPAFIKTGELINVNTETEEYCERVTEGR